MIIIGHKENAINKESVTAMVNLANSDNITMRDVFKFYRKWGIIFTDKDEVERLKEKWL